MCAPPPRRARCRSKNEFNPLGELIVIIMCEDVQAIDNLPETLRTVGGIGVVLIGVRRPVAEPRLPASVRSSRGRGSDDGDPPNLHRASCRLAIRMSMQRTRNASSTKDIDSWLLRRRGRIRGWTRA